MFSLIPLPYRLLAGILIFVGLMTAAYLSGHHREAVVMQAKIDALKVSYAAAQAKAQAQADAKAQAQTQAFAQTAADYERKLSDASKQHAVDVAAIRARTLRLRDSGGRCSAPPASPAAAASDGATGCELSQQLDEFLLSEANRADQVTLQLQACQAVIIEDRAEH